MAHDVFISYSHIDKAIADGICANLEGAGVRCWIAPRDIGPGEDWPTSIAQAIPQCRIMVLVFSANSNKSKQVSNEISLAFDNNLVIIPFKIDNVQPEPGKNYYLARTHWLDAMNPPTREQINKLVSHVKSFLIDQETGGTSEPAREVKPPAAEIATPPAGLHSPPQQHEKPEINKLRKKAAPRGIWIWGPLLVIALMAGGAYAIRFFGADAQTAPPTATSTFTSTFTPTSTITHTRTPRPTATATPPPGWVTDFAGPILAAIADLPPTFQDDFGPASAGWQSVDWCGNNIDYVEGALVITRCWAFRPNISYDDFVVEFDVRFLPGADQEERFSFTFKNFADIGDGHTVSIKPDGNVEINYHSGSRNTDTTNITFNNAAHKGNQSNHILVIGKGSRFAIYLNNQPLSHFESPYGSYGDFGFLAGRTIVAIDNIKVWNIADISLP